MCKNGRIWRWVDYTVGHSTLKLNANGEPLLRTQKGLKLMDDWGYAISNDDESRLGDTGELDDNQEGG